MKLASLDDIKNLKVDHKVGALVNELNGSKVTLTPFRIVYARFGRKLFQQSLSGSWSLVCASGDAVTGRTVGDDEFACGSEMMCRECKPILMLGLRTEKGSLATLETTASVAREFSYRLTKGPEAIFAPVWALRIMLTEKGRGMKYAQVQLHQPRRDQVGPLDYDACMAARARLAPIIDAKLDRGIGGGKPSLAGASLKM